MSAPPELDEETKARLRWEAERLAAEQEISLQDARQIVWADYQDELAAHAATASTTKPEAVPLDTPVPEPPALLADAPAHHSGGFWKASETTFFTPERLAANREQLNKVKQLIGLRSK